MRLEKELIVAAVTCLQAATALDGEYGGDTLRDDLDPIIVKLQAIESEVAE